MTTVVYRIYWKDKPNETLLRTFAILSPEDNLMEIEMAIDDDDIFYYITDGYEEINHLTRHNNGEDFVIIEEPYLYRT